MAIKFSQFTVRTSSSDLSHIVGYNGVDNIQITPTNFLNSALTGTAGQVLFYDTTGVAGDNDLYWDNTNKQLGVGTTSPSDTLTIDNDNNLLLGLNAPAGNDAQLRFYSAGNYKSIIYRPASSNDLRVNTVTSGDVLTIQQSGNVGIGTTSPSEKLQVEGNIKVGDSQQFVAGASNDLRIYHEGTDSIIQNYTGSIYIDNNADDQDIVFRCDDGSGGLTEYFRVDGSATVTVFEKDARFNDNIDIKLGSGNDCTLFHNGTDTFIDNGTGDLTIRNQQDDGDINFVCDNGSGGNATYFAVDGGGTDINFFKDTHHIDNVIAKFGSDSAGDLKIKHDGTDSYIQNLTGNLEITNNSDDKDIIFRSDDGSGGLAEYFRVDGAEEQVRFFKPTEHGDGVLARFGDSGDLRIYHDGSNSHIQANGTGDLFIQQFRDDGDIVFQSDDGSGGVETYFYLDGGASKNVSNKNFRIIDSKIFSLGSSDDFQLYHNTADSWIENYTGNINIRNRQDDGDIIFYSDDGAGGHAQYFRIDGGAANNIFSKNTKFGDGVEILVGDGNDLHIYHNGSDSYVSNDTGDLYIRNSADNKDVIFQSDDGSGGMASYLKLWGAIESLAVYKDMLMVNDGNGGKLKFGASQDLQIYHDGSNSFIADTGTGKLKVLASQFDVINAANTEFMAEFIENAEVRLYHNNSKKFETTSTGIKISGVSEYADNAAAIAGGLTTGDVYRTGDLLKIVH